MSNATMHEQFMAAVVAATNGPTFTKQSLL
jgi:hypothetical protein